MDNLVRSDGEPVPDTFLTPDGAWPPTDWCENWVTGRDVFGLDRERSPIESRRLVFRRTDPQG